MKRWRKTLKRAMAIALVTMMFGSSLPVSVVYAEEVPAAELKNQNSENGVSVTLEGNMIYFYEEDSLTYYQVGTGEKQQYTGSITVTGTGKIKIESGTHEIICKDFKGTAGTQYPVIYLNEQTEATLKFEGECTLDTEYGIVIDAMTGSTLTIQGKVSVNDNLIQSEGKLNIKNATVVNSSGIYAADGITITDATVEADLIFCITTEEKEVKQLEVSGSKLKADIIMTSALITPDNGTSSVLEVGGFMVDETTYTDLSEFQGIIKYIEDSSYASPNNNTVIVYGNAALDSDFTIPKGVTMKIPTGTSLTLNANLENNGTLSNNGTVIFGEKGQISGNGTFEICADSSHIWSGGKCRVCKTLGTTIREVAITDIDAPKGGSAFDTSAVSDTPKLKTSDLTVTWKKGSESAGETAEYGESYTASVTLALAEDAVFAEDVTVTVNGKPAEVSKNEDGTITITCNFVTEAKKKVVRVTAPTVPEGNQFAEQYTTFDEVLHAGVLGNSAMVSIEGEEQPICMEVEWSLANANEAGYDAQASAENIFQWTIKQEEYQAYDTGTIEMQGTVTIANKAHKDDDRDGRCDDCGNMIYGVILRGSNLTLNGNIGLNFYFQFADDNIKSQIMQNETAVVRFTLEDGRVVEIPVKYGSVDTTTIPETTLYRYSCELYAKQMTDSVTAEFVMDDNIIASYTHSIADYAKIILTNAEKKYTEAEIGLVKAMLNYGANAQKCFSYHADRLANAELSEADKTLDAVSSAIFENNKPQNMGIEGVGTFAGSSLVLESETTLKVYFEPAAGITLETLTFTVENKDIKVSESGQYYVIEISNIKANELKHNFKISVSEAGSGEVKGTFDCSVYTYCYSVLSDTKGNFKEEVKNTLKALYLYSEAANQYFTN